ncbi:hypothetical protein GCK72_011759 [Caenorhabditis remanei]|uniref:Uncharacterized protein n=1 Tax=Caenorhabditis remanei TaxID=31234 RepID=A0A6A5HAN2_CAERE|nr:hypothetical protein GCK72_011759 [Caenorhabditis remanei]KAF1763493.1 hypothetical protein GCK72_011759 [Caenorhabditis remanei]
MMYFDNYNQQSAQEQSGMVYWAPVNVPTPFGIPGPVEMPVAQHTGFNEGPRILDEFSVGNITIRIHDCTPRHIFKKHWKDFQHATRGARDWNTVERNVSSFLKKLILSSPQLLFTDELVTRKDGLLLYVRQPRDKMFHRIALAQDEAEGHVYNVSTAYKLWIDEAVQFSGQWKEFGSQQDVNYHPRMTGIFTRTSWNSHLANIHHRPTPQIAEVPLQYIVPHFVFSPVPNVQFAPPSPQFIQFLPYPPPVYA